MTHVTVALKADVIDDVVVSSSLNKKEKLLAPDSVNKCIERLPPALPNQRCRCCVLARPANRKRRGRSELLLGTIIHQARHVLRM